MQSAWQNWIEHVATGLEIAGVLIILSGIVLATIRATHETVGRLPEVYDRYRARLGQAILLGLEVLVGADIVATVSAPLTFQSVGLLGLVVLIRTFLSVSLETEIEGRFPWDRGRPKDRQPKA